MQNPSTLDGAAVLAVADLARRAPSGRTRHFVGREQVLTFDHLALAQYAGEDGVYLFYCDAEWRVVTDTLHESLEAALGQAEDEFGVVQAEWAMQHHE